MSLEDLMDRGMEIADFLVPQEKTEEFFYAILDELEMPESFLDTGMLSFRVTPKPDKVDVFVTKSKIEPNLDLKTYRICQIWKNWLKCRQMSLLKP